MIRIKNWNETFENADTRKRVRLGWFSCPSGVDSAGYVELMSKGEAGLKAYAVFLAICQWSATCLPVVRGSCARSDGRPMSVRQIAAAIRIDERTVVEAVAVLSSKDIGWLIVENLDETKEWDESASHLPVVCQSSAGCLPESATRKEKGEGEVKGEGEELMSVPSNGPVRADYPNAFEAFWLSFPKVRRTKKKEAFRKWKLVTKSVDAELLTNRAAEYAQSPKGRSEYAVMPSVWLNSGMWEDDAEAWEEQKSPSNSRNTNDSRNNPAAAGRGSLV